MLAEKSYPTAYVTACRQRVRDQVAAYAALGLTAGQQRAFEPAYAETLVLALDHLFTHRMRSQEGRGTLQLVRVLCEQVRDGTAPAMSVAEFAELGEAFLAEIEERFPETVPTRA